MPPEIDPNLRGKKVSTTTRWSVLARSVEWRSPLSSVLYNLLHCSSPSTRDSDCTGKHEDTAANVYIEPCNDTGYKSIDATTDSIIFFCPRWK